MPSPVVLTSLPPKARTICAAASRRSRTTFTVPASDYNRARDTITSAKTAIGYARLDSATDVAKVSVIGSGMRSHAGVAGTMFKTLADRGINIQVISTSEIKVSVLIAEEYTELAVRALHSAYELDA